MAHAMSLRVKELDWPSEMPDDEWDDVSSTLPTTDEPFIQQYLNGREALIDQEKMKRSGT